MLFFFFDLIEIFIFKRFNGLFKFFGIYGKFMNNLYINIDSIIRWRFEKILYDVENRGKKFECFENSNILYKYFGNLRIFSLKKRRFTDV